MSGIDDDQTTTIDLIASVSLGICFACFFCLGYIIGKAMA